MRKSILLFIVGFAAINPILAQSAKLEGGNVKEQLEFIESKASRWQTYTMIPDPFFTLMNKSILDTIGNKEAQIADLKQVIKKKDAGIAGLKKQLDDTQVELAKTQDEKDSFSLFGMLLSKGFFLNLVTFIFIGLLVVAGGAVLFMNRERSVALRAKKDLEQLKQEFEDYRQESRIAKEKLVVQHHRQLQKLKGG